MPFDLPLPDSLRNARWKVKIRDKEILEPPHVTVLRGTSAWRINLRSGEFLDADPDPSEVPHQIVDLIRQESNWQRLRDAWDRAYPSNPVAGEEE